MSALRHVTIFTDGAASPNPGPGGYGVVLKYGKHRKELSGGFEKTTNNRMELMAAIAALEALKHKCKVSLHSDSEYLVRSLESGSAFKWRDQGWWRSTKSRAKNADLWERLLKAYDRHDVTMIWIEGHAGDPENERCDRLAREAARRDALTRDEGYEAAQREQPRSIQEGDPCLKCKTPLVKRIPKRPHRPGQTYFYEYYLYCPGCTGMFMVEEAKREIAENKSRLLLRFD